ncbi:group II intron reverse transcriptase domain-containing protein [Candidatus Uhrbacteria bacterium]|nr:group II intron reverse transcriptase domain-containing protein [Candidatus Uhrbacteria bacterium]
MEFGRNFEDHLFCLRDDLLSGNYRHGPYHPFTIFDPKQREIHKAAVRDRVVHQAIVNVIEPLFDVHFIHDSYSCRLGKGTHAAVKRLQSFLRQASRNDTKTVYALKCDVRKFFASVDHKILLRLLTNRISDERVMDTLVNIISSFETSPGKGIPLGNLTSQLFANIYLHELDWHVKQRLRIRHYVRYCDDFVLLVDSTDQAFALAEQVDTFLQENLSIKLHPNKVLVRTWKQGIDFLGYVLLPHAMILRPKTVQRMVSHITKENATSYLGLCTHADAYELERLLKNKMGGSV